MKCSKTNASEPDWACSAEALHDSIYCLMHDDRPETIAKVRDAQSRGGRNKSAFGAVDISIDLSSADAILGTLQGVAEALASGRIDRSRANALNYLATTAVNAHRVIGYEKRLKKIEERLQLREPEASDGE
jgi:hypothetical protein